MNCYLFSFSYFRGMCQHSSDWRLTRSWLSFSSNSSGRILVSSHQPRPINFSTRTIFSPYKKILYNEFIFYWKLLASSKFTFQKIRCTKRTSAMNVVYLLQRMLLCDFCWKIVCYIENGSNAKFGRQVYAGIYGYSYINIFVFRGKIQVFNILRAQSDLQRCT